MKATRTYNTDLVRQIMLRPEIFATCSEDGQDPADYQPDLAASCWLVMTAPDDVLVGLYVLHQRNAVTLEIHAHVLPEHRKVYSESTGRAALAWVLEHVPDCQKIIAHVPALYPNVRDFALRQGFHNEGTNRKSFLKGGKLYDQWHLGVTREELETCLTL